MREVEELCLCSCCVDKRDRDCGVLVMGTMRIEDSCNCKNYRSEERCDCGFCTSVVAACNARRAETNSQESNEDKTKGTNTFTRCEQCGQLCSSIEVVDGERMCSQCVVNELLVLRANARRPLEDTKTLRDEFAISLAASICAEHIRTPVEPEWRGSIAIEAYRIADLMMLERKERHGCLKIESQDTLPPDPKTAEAKIARLEKWLDDTDRAANLESLEMTERLDRFMSGSGFPTITKRDAILSFTLAVRRVLKGTL